MVEPIYGVERRHACARVGFGDDVQAAVRVEQHGHLLLRLNRLKRRWLPCLVQALRAPALLSLTPAPAVPPVREGVGVDDALDHLGAHPRQARASHDLVDRAHAGQRVLDGREREVGAEEDLVGDQILLRRDHDVPELPRPVVDRRELGVHVRLFAHHRNRVLVPGVAHVGEDHLELGVAQRHRLDMDRAAEVDRGIAREGGAHVHGERQVVRDAVLVDRRHARVVERHAVVDRAVLNAPEAEVLYGMAQQLHAIGPARVGVGEAHEFVRILLHRGRGGRIVALDPSRIAVAQRKHDRPFNALHRRVERVGVRL
jgi:hypothetical protein